MVAPTAILAAVSLAIAVAAGPLYGLCERAAAELLDRAGYVRGGARMRRYVPYAVGLAVAWVMLWDQITLANFLGGLAVAAVLLVVFPLPPVDPQRRLIVRPWALVRLAAAVRRRAVRVQRVHDPRGRHPRAAARVRCRAVPDAHGLAEDRSARSPTSSPWRPGRWRSTPPTARRRCSSTCSASGDARRSAPQGRPARAARRRGDRLGRAIVAAVADGGCR